MRALLKIFLGFILFGLIIGDGSGATITFNKPLDVPDRDFTVTYEGSTFSFTIADVGNYKIGDNVGITVTGGVNNMRLVLFTVDKLTPWFSTFYDTGGSVSATIPADKFDVNCPDVCDYGSGYIMGPGVYALAIQNRDGSNYFIAKPVIISKYDMTVVPEITQASPGGTINVTVNVYLNGNPVSVGSNNVKVEFVQGTNTHFNGIAETTATTGVYKANIQIPSSASGNYQLYAAVTTSRNIYQDYPEIIGASSYSGTIRINSAGTSTQTSTGGGNGGGGGGGGTSGESFTNIIVREKYYLHILKDMVTSYRFTNNSNPVLYVNITGNTSPGETVTQVEVLRDTSTLVNSPAPGTVYENVNIWVGTSGFAVPKNIKQAVVVFRVKDSWLKSNNMEGDRIRLERWDNTRWVELETAEKDKDGTYAYFEANTDAFSPFAITGIKGEAVPTPAPVIEVTETPVPSPTTTEKTPGFELILASAVLYAVYLFRRMRT